MSGQRCARRRAPVAVDGDSMNSQAGRFIVIEGPNGVGKTTVAGLLTDRLRAASVAVYATSEPSSTPLGRLLRHAEEALTGRALALAIAADRAHHINVEIIPQLDDGASVVCDRYVPSSLVLQRVDGMDTGEIWTYNRYCLPPDLLVYLDEDAETIASRLSDRARLSRLETTGSPAEELRLYAEARAFLASEGWRQHVVDCRDRAPDDVVDEILTLINQLEA